MTLLKRSGYASTLMTGSRTHRLGDFGEPLEKGSNQYTQIYGIHVEDIGAGLVHYSLMYGIKRNDAWQLVTLESFTFGGVFWIKWEEERK